MSVDETGKKTADLINHSWPQSAEPALGTELRTRLGKSLRKTVSRTSHANWSAPHSRTNPIDLLRSQDSLQNRLPFLIPYRYGRMMVSPSSFFRGAALIMAADLVQTPRTGLNVQCCGDAHLNNFGIFATPERNIIFDLNDFDETLPGPWEWDVKRLAASIAIAATDKGFTTNAASICVRDMVREYRTRMKQLAQMSSLEVWYHKLLVEDLANQIRRPERKAALLAKIERFKQKKTHEGVFAKMTEIVDGARRFKESPPLLTHHADATPEMMQVVLNNYLATMPPSHQRLINRYQIVDVVLKAVGVGSVGTTAGVILLRGDGGGEDSIFLQVKQASRSVLEQYVGMSSFAHCGERVVVGQRLLQSASDMFLGWTTGPRRKEYYVRQLMDAKGSVDVATLDEIALAHYAEVCGHALARAHARTGDPQMLAGYMGDGEVLDEAIAAFALTYAEQNRRDYQLLLQAIKKGEIVAAQG